jgi:hypothetical protein
MSHYRSQADASQKAHANKIISAAGGGGHSAPHGQDGSAKRKGFKNGGRCYEDGGIVEEAMEGEMSSARLDRPSRKGKGATTVNVVIAQKPDAPAAPPMPIMPPIPMGPPAGAPPPPMPMGPPPGAGAPGGLPPELMGRKRGGRVMADAGAGSGEGRLDKIKDYGAKAGKPAKTPKND